MDINYILNNELKITKLKDKQKEIIDYILASKDVIGILPTGYGKSICFQLPALALDGVTLVISPLIALMQDQVIGLKRKGIRACFINSSLSYEEINKVYSDIKKNKYKIVYVAGERLQSKEFVDLFLSIKISLITVDEAHTLVWGDTFRYSLNNIYSFINLLENKPPILALTATASNDALIKIKSILHLGNANIVKVSLDRTNIFYITKITSNKKNELFTYLIKNKGKLGIIYTLTVKSCNNLYVYLKNLGFRVGIYHGRLSKEEKDEAINSFINDSLDIIVCSSAFGMGIDKPNVRYVINYDIPLSIEELAQELGRCGRDGQKAESIVYFDPKDIKSCNYFIDNLNNPGLSSKDNFEIKRRANKSLDKVIDYATTRGCLHKFMLKQFGEILDGKCMNCSNCVKIK